MRRQFALVAQDPVLRMCAIGALLFGSFVSSIGIYQSLIAINVIGLSQPAYAAILVAAMIAGVATAVGVGIVTDQRPSRRRMAIVAVLGSLGGATLVWMVPTKLGFILAHAILFPLGGTLFTQIFAVARLTALGLPEADRPGIMATVRAMFAIPFVVLLPLWGLAADLGMSLLSIYPGILIFALLHLAVILRYWPHDADAPWIEVKSGLHFRSALAEMLTPPVLARVQLMGVVQTGGALSGVLVGLAFDAAGRGAGDVGLFFAIFIAFEVLGTLMLGSIAHLLPRLKMIALGSVIYVAYLMLLAPLAYGPWIWLLVLPAGLGGALIYTPLIAYLQDLLGARAGAGASLLALGRIGQDMATAGAFWIGTALAGYGLVGILGALFTSLAIGTVIAMDRARPQ